MQFLQFLRFVNFYGANATAIFCGANATAIFYDSINFTGGSRLVKIKGGGLRLFRSCRGLRGLCGSAIRSGLKMAIFSARAAAKFHAANAG